MIQIIADEKALTLERVQKWPDVTDNLPFFCQDQKRQEPNNPQSFCTGRVSSFLVIRKIAQFIRGYLDLSLPCLLCPGA